MPYLEIKLGPETLRLRLTPRFDYVFGRLPGADVQLRDMKVSRLHAQFFTDSRGAAFVRDLGSSVGTLVSKKRLGKGVIAPLADGRRFRVGEAVATYFEGEPPKDAIEPPGNSSPRALIRTNARDRSPLPAPAGNTPDKPGAPAEPPPPVNPKEFAGENRELHDSGIVEAPWDKRDSAPVKPSDRKKVVAVTAKQKPEEQRPPVMPSAEIDEHGNFVAPSPRAAEPTTPPAATAGEPMSPEALEAGGPSAGTAPPESASQFDSTAPTAVGLPPPPDVKAVEAFRPPPDVTTGEMPVPANETPPPKRKVKIPTVRIERVEMEERGREIDEEEAGRPRAQMPTARIDKDGPSPVIDDFEDVAPKFSVKGDSGGMPRYNEANGAKEPPATEPIAEEKAIQSSDDQNSSGHEDDETGRESPGSFPREGATPERTFKPRKTRKLMKRRTEPLDKKTDGDAAAAPPDAEPDKPTQGLAQGPGGDTVALTKEQIMEQLALRDSQQSSIGEQPTVRKANPDDIRDADLRGEDGYSTDSLDGSTVANDFSAESDRLPTERKAPERGNDTQVE